MFLRMILNSRYFPRYLAGLIFLSALSACSSHSNLPELQVGRQSVGQTSHSSAAYRLRVGDKLKINVFGEQDLSGAYEVDAGGYVPFPLIGQVRAADTTINQFRTSLQRKLASGYLKNPKLTVDIVNYRPIYVHGEVRKGGEHPYKAGLTVSDTIALAGGYTYRADESYIVLSRANQSKTYRVRLPSRLKILPGDNIRVPERFF